LDGLQHLVQLEELSLEDNQLRSLDAIEPLKLLKKLDVGKNQLTSVSRQ
jgi:Leucine-rich repeat (LRR) protein